MREREREREREEEEEGEGEITYELVIEFCRRNKGEVGAWVGVG